VLAGIPGETATYELFELNSKPFYIHRDLLEMKIEVFLTGSESSDALAAREY